VTASDNGIKILANRDGLQLLRAFETTRSFDTNRVAPEPAVSKPPVGNALGVVSTQGGSGSGAGERPSAGSMAGSGMDAPTLNMGRVRPRDRAGNDHVSVGLTYPESLPFHGRSLNMHVTVTAVQTAPQSFSVFCGLGSFLPFSLLFFVC
jgi:hypothetical protein